MERLWSRAAGKGNRESPMIFDRFPTQCYEFIGSSACDTLQVVKNADFRAIGHALNENGEKGGHDGHEESSVAFEFALPGSQYIMAT